MLKSFQLCLTLCDPMSHSLRVSSVLGDSPGENTGVGCHALLQGIFPTQDSNLSLASPALEIVFFTTSTTWEASPPPPKKSRGTTWEASPPPTKKSRGKHFIIEFSGCYGKHPTPSPRGSRLLRSCSELWLRGNRLSKPDVKNMLDIWNRSNTFCLHMSSDEKLLHVLVTLCDWRFHA